MIWISGEQSHGSSDTANEATTLRSIPRDVGRRCHRRRSVSTIVSGPVKTRWVSSVPRARLENASRFLDQRTVAPPLQPSDHWRSSRGGYPDGVARRLATERLSLSTRSARFGVSSPADQVRQEARISPAQATVRLHARDQQSRFDGRGVHAKGKKRATSPLRSRT
jgi:hypothetical protein